MKEIVFMKEILKYIWVFFILLVCLVVSSFLFSNPTGLHSKKENISSWILPVSGILEQVNSEVTIILDDNEVQSTLSRIEKDIPKYNKDGAIFMNREKLIPVQRDKNYYSEWTVITPWEDDRGARRIIEGKRGELYFTDDHYDSFTRIR